MPNDVLSCWVLVGGKSEREHGKSEEWKAHRGRIVMRLGSRLWLLFVEVVQRKIRK